MMAEHQTVTDDPIGAYARAPPPVFSQVHLPERSRLNTDYLKSLPGILKITTIVSTTYVGEGYLLMLISQSIMWSRLYFANYLFFF